MYNFQCKYSENKTWVMALSPSNLLCRPCLTNKLTSHPVQRYRKFETEGWHNKPLHIFWTNYQVLRSKKMKKERDESAQSLFTRPKIRCENFHFTFTLILFLPRLCAIGTTRAQTTEYNNNSAAAAGII
jgi:hypothetical protein